MNEDDYNANDNAVTYTLHESSQSHFKTISRQH